MGNEKIKVVFASFWPIGIGLIQYLMWPGLVTPFLNHPVFRVVILFAALWLVIGFLFMRKHNKTWQIGFAQIVFTIPVMMLPILGPAGMALVTAISELKQQN